MSDSVWHHRWQPTRLPCPWDSPDKKTGVGCHFLLQCTKVKSESEIAQSCPTLSDLMDCSLPGSPSIGFSRQEYWSGVPLPSPRKWYICSLFTSRWGHSVRNQQKQERKCWINLKVKLTWINKHEFLSGLVQQSWLAPFCVKISPIFCDSLITSIGQKPGTFV